MHLFAKFWDSIGRNRILPLLQKIDRSDLNKKVAEKAYRPDIMEKEMKLHAKIDRRIEKIMRALVMAREFKKQYLAKPVLAKSLAGPPIVAEIPDGSAGGAKQLGLSADVNGHSLKKEQPH